MKYNHNLVGLFGLYCGQGAPLGLAIFALPGILRQQGADMQFIGLIGLCMLPWAFKFIWASFIENHKPWGFGKLSAGLAWIQLFKILSLLAVASLWFFSPQTDVIGLLIILTFINLLYASQDVAVDALAVRTFAGSRHVKVNVGQVAGFSLGMLVGGILSLYVFSSVGWHNMVLFFLLVQIVCHIPFMLNKDKFNIDQQLPVKPGSASVWKIFRRQGSFPVILMALLFKFASTLGAGLISPLLVDMGVNLEFIALISGSVLIISYITGALAAGLLHRWFSSPTLALSGLIASALCWLGLAISLTVSSTDPTMVFIFFMLEGFFFNLSCVSFFSCFMCWSEGDSKQDAIQPGTNFTLLQCCEVLGSSAAMVIAGTLAHYWGFTHAFYAAVVGSVTTIIIVTVCFRLSSSMINRPSVQLQRAEVHQ
ncbi:MFS transporter [Photorhabdus temperata]|uniref:MFS transporter n=1 Tax=Photorhabdus temperata J3 TaxID=1389415 RepID=U7R8J5_PHOTE|nr:MFS transporter [Photorhabdus temperata]ERT15081.1 hypothetical protein O185_00140 [Photorhabdus temperata J3]